MTLRNKRKILKRNFRIHKLWMNSVHLYRSIQIIRVRLRYKEIKKGKTVNFYCIVDYAHWGHYIKKKNAPYCSTSVVVWKRIKNTKIKEILDFYTL
jgi:hypothetical protein